MYSLCQLSCPGTVDVLGSDRNALLTESFQLLTTAASVRLRELTPPTSGQ